MAMAAAAAAAAAPLVKLRVAVCGGGPAGLLVALGLADQGHTVVVVEKLDHPAKRGTVNRDRSYPVDITARGMAVLERAGALPGEDCALRRRLLKFYGHAFWPDFKATSATEGLIGTRDDAVLGLLDHIAGRSFGSGGKVELLFNVDVGGVDLPRRFLTPALGGPALPPVAQGSFDLIVACDGKNSPVRDSAAQQDPALIVCPRDGRDGEELYKTVNFDLVGKDPLAAFLGLVTAVPWGVLGTQLGLDKQTAEKAPEPDVETAFVDPAGLGFIQEQGPGKAGGASASMYKFLGIQEFPQDVVAGIQKATDAKLHKYDNARVIHAVGPDFRSETYADGDRQLATEALTVAYRNVLREYGASGLRRLRLLPLSGGIFSGGFAPALPEMTAVALSEAFKRLDAQHQKHVLASSLVELCIFLEQDFEKYGGALGGMQTAARTPPAEAANKLRSELGRDAQIVCILGGTKFNDANSEALVKAIASKVDAALGSKATFVTGGMAGVQETFARHCGDGSRVWNLLPLGQSSGFGSGTDINAGVDLEQRKAIFGLVGDIYVTVEGGPGVAQEARAAHARGAAVVPLMRTGGASGGMFDFPAGARQKPDFCTEEVWSLLKSKDATVDESAAAAVAVVEACVTASAAKGAPRKAEAPTLEEGWLYMIGGVPPQCVIASRMPSTGKGLGIMPLCTADDMSSDLLEQRLPPDAFAFISEEERKAFNKRPLCDAGGGFTTSRLSVGGCVALVGDAATSPPPAGQGINHALEAAWELVEAVRWASGEVGDVSGGAGWQQGVFLNLVTPVPWGVLGTQLTKDKKEQARAPKPDSEIAFVDPAGLSFIQEQGPGKAGAASGAIYRFLGTHEDAMFPHDVVAAVKNELDAKLHAYDGARVVHAVGPDFRKDAYKQGGQEHAIQALTTVYYNVLREYASSPLQCLRLLPLSGGVFSGTFAPQLPAMTAAALAAAFLRLSAQQRRSVLASTQIELCIFMEQDFEPYSAALQRVREAARQEEAALARRAVEAYHEEQYPNEQAYAFLGAPKTWMQWGACLLGSAVGMHPWPGPSIKDSTKPYRELTLMHRWVGSDDFGSSPDRPDADVKQAPQCWISCCTTRSST